MWRALNRILISLPRALDDDLVRETGLTLNAYAVLMSLSEAEDQEMRMLELASATTLSPSRVSRLMDELRGRGLVAKRPCADDRRGNIAGLTEEGLARLEAAYPAHLASARRRVMDQIRPASMPRLAEALRDIAAGLDQPTP